MSEDKDILKLIKELENAEEKFEEFADELRENVKKIFELFGDADECRICGYTEKSWMHYKYFSRKDYKRYNELPKDREVRIIKPNEKVEPEDDSIEYWELVEEYHEFKPKIQVPIDITSKTPFYKTHGEWGLIEYKLRFRAHRLEIVRYIEQNEAVTFTASEAPLAILRELIKSNGLIDFLKYTVAQLKEQNKSYEGVSKIAKQMAEAIK